MAAVAVPSSDQATLLSRLQEQLIECLARKRSWKDLRVPNLDPGSQLAGARSVKMLLLDEEELKCPVCLLMLGSNGIKIHACPKGHAFCEGCITGTRCPCCQIPLPIIRSESLLHRKLISSLISECILGCRTVLSFEQMKTHELECIYSSKNVCYFCTEQVAFKDFLSHLESSHNNMKQLPSEQWIGRVNPGAFGVTMMPWTGWIPLHRAALLILGFKWSPPRVVFEVAVWSLEDNLPCLDWTFSISGCHGTIFSQTWNGVPTQASWRKVKDGCRSRETLSFPFPMEEAMNVQQQQAQMFAFLWSCS